MVWRGRAATLVVLLATAIAFAFALPRLELTTKITAFLPDDDANRGAQIAALLADSELARVMVIDVSLGRPAGDADPLGELAQALLDYLRAEPSVAVARSGFGDQEIAGVLAFLRAIPPTTFVPRSAYSDDQLRARLGALRDQLAGPGGVVVRQTAPRDPLGGMWEPLEALRAAQGTSVIDVDGVLRTADRAHAFILVETKASPFDSDAQRAFRALLDGWMARAAPVGARLETAGAAQFAIVSEQQIKGDVNRIGVISTIGIVALFIVLFGSARLIALGLVPMAFGSVVAVLVCQAVYGEIHGITIAFGSSLLGVGLDYVEHYYAHFVLTPTVPAATTMRRVAPSLALGALTTIVGFIGIAASGLAGMRQMAVFSVVAIIASICATYWIVPRWMPVRYRPARALGYVQRGVRAVLARVTRRRWSRAWRAIALVAALGVAALAVHAATFTDQVNMLIQEGGAHAVEDRAVRARLGGDASAFAVVTAPSDEALLVAIGAATDELAVAQAQGAIESFVPLARLVPSVEEQRARRAAAREAAPRIRRIMEELELVPEQFAAFFEAIGEANGDVVTLADLRRSPLAPLLAAWIPAHGTPLALIPLVGIRDPEALRALAPSAAIVAPSETITELFRGVRIRTITASAIGFCVIFLLLLARYRRLRSALLALAPALLACIATVAVLVAAGIPLTILHVMSFLLVVSLGVDFGIFFVDAAATLEEAARTMVSILTASITTILSFGLLSLSDSPGLAAIGITVTLGVTFSLLWCFVMASLRGEFLQP